MNFISFLCADPSRSLWVFDPALDAGNDASDSGADGSTRNPRGRHRRWDAPESFDRFRMDQAVQKKRMDCSRIPQSSRCPPQTQAATGDAPDRHTSSSGLCLWVQLGSVDRTASPGTDQEDLWDQTPPQAYASVSTTFGAGAQKPRATRPGTRPQSCTPLEAVRSAGGHALRPPMQRLDSLRGRKLVRSDSPYRQNMDFPRGQTYRASFREARCSCGCHIGGQPERPSPVPVVQKQFQLRNLAPFYGCPASAFQESQAFFHYRWRSMSQGQSHRTLRQGQRLVAIALLPAQLFARTQSGRGSLEPCQNQTAQRPADARQISTPVSRHRFPAVAAEKTRPSPTILQNLSLLNNVTYYIIYIGRHLSMLDRAVGRSAMRRLE